MKLFYTFLVIFLSLTNVGSNNNMVGSSEPIEDSRKVDELIGVFSTPNELGTVRYTYELYPKEIYYGDPVYLIYYAENISNEIIPDFPLKEELPFSETFIKNVIVKPEENIRTSDLEYKWTREISQLPTVSACYAQCVDNLYPGEKRIIGFTCLDSSPLEDYDDSFWRELRNSLSPEGILCSLYISDPDSPPNSWKQSILIKPRPENKMKLLNEWYNQTPKELFPVAVNGKKLPWNHNELKTSGKTIYTKSSGKSDIEINGEKYNPWLFIRTGNRKPSDPNNPTTLEGWRELEESLVPSTMRDEIHLTRLLLEYYSAKGGKATITAENELVNWLNALPEPQRMVLTAYLTDSSYRFSQTSLSDKNKLLMRRLSDPFDFDSNKTIDRSQRYESPSVESMRPTQDDLAACQMDEFGSLMSKELPNGFRIWDLYYPKGTPNRFVLKFLGKADNKQSNSYKFKTREGKSIYLRINDCSKEDQEYIYKAENENMK